MERKGLGAYTTWPFLNGFRYETDSVNDQAISLHLQKHTCVPLNEVMKFNAKS